MSEQVLIQYAPYIVIIIAFLVQCNVFVTPKGLHEEMDKKLEKYVLKETHSVTVDQLKADMAEMKDKLDKIYDKIMNV